MTHSSTDSPLHRILTECFKSRLSLRESNVLSEFSRSERRQYCFLKQFLSGALLICVCSLSCTLLADDNPSPRKSEEWRHDLQQGTLDDRRAAAFAIRKCDLEQQRELLPVFIDLLRHETDGQIRLAVLDVISDMGESAADAVPALTNAMRKDFGGRRNEEKHQNFRSALALARIGPPAVEGLRNLLGEEDEQARYEAAMALGRIGEPAAPALRELIDLLDDEEPTVRREVVQAIGRIGESAIPSLVEAIVDEDSIVRAGVIESLGLAGLSIDAHPTAVSLVLDALDDESPAVRKAALQSAAGAALPQDKLQEVLFTGLQDSEDSIRAVSVNTLVDKPQVLKSLESRLSSLLVAEDEGVAWHAAYLLSRLGSDAVPTLETALDDERSRVDQIAQAFALLGQPIVDRMLANLESLSARYRQAAVLALGRIRPLSTDTVRRLETILADRDPNVTVSCLQSFRELGAQARGALPAVRELIQSDRPDVRMLVLEILFRSAPRDRQLIQDFILLVNDDDPQVQTHALEAIRSSGPFGRAALPQIIEKLNSENKAVRLAAAKCVAGFGGAAAEAVPVLIELLEEGDVESTIIMMETLGELGTAAQPALSSLKKLARGPSAEIRLAALRTLANLQLDVEQIRDVFVAALHDEEKVRSDVVWIIRRLGRRGLVFVTDLIPLLANDSDRDSIARVLDRFESYGTDPQSIPALVELTKHKHSDVKLRAIKFLELAGEAGLEALPVLERLAESSSEESIREAAASAANKIASAPASVSQE